MAKTMQTGHPGQTEAPSSASDNTKKLRKKQAKREAKMMLKVEQARKDVQKAEQKAAKAQTDLESTKTHLSKLEAQGQELSAPATSTVTATAPKKAKSAKSRQQQANAQTHSVNHAKSTAGSAHETTTPVATGKRSRAASSSTSST